MADLLVLVLHAEDKCLDLIEAWERIGVPGVTVLESTGSRQLREQANRDDLPLVPSMRALFSSIGEHNRTMFAVINEPALLEYAIQLAHEIVGNFDDPHTGVLFVLPVSRAWGIRKGPTDTTNVASMKSLKTKT